MKNFVFLGAPGVGKGTMAKEICKDKGYLQISTGDLLRAQVAAGTPLGKKAKAIMDAGGLVPDEVVAELLAQAIREASKSVRGFIFDGYPRTIPQAHLLDKILADAKLTLTGVVLLDALPEVIMVRLTGRRVCRACGAIYHLQFGPPKVAGVCDKCGGKDIYQRTDDNETSVRQRLVAYDQQTKPLIDFYSGRKLLLRVDASRDKDANYQSLCTAVDAWLMTR